MASDDEAAAVEAVDCNLLHACRLTCIGGSERGTCECVGPKDCPMKGHPGFEAARAEAIRRICKLGGVDPEPHHLRPEGGTDGK